MADIDYTKATTSKSKKRTKWLIGSYSPEILGSKLPSKRNVLSVVFWNLENKKNLKEAADIVVAQVLKFWNKARIPTRQKQHIKTKVSKLHQEYANLRKNKSNKQKRSVALEEKEKCFERDLDNLFDIAHADAETIMKNQEDIAFLKAQREEGRRGCMIGEDNKLFKEEEKKQKTILRKKAYEERHRSSDYLTTPGPSHDSDHDTGEETVEENTTDEGDEEYQLATTTKKRHFTKPIIDSTPSKKVKVSGKKLLSPKVASALDRTGISDREAMHIIAPIAEAVGLEANDVTLSRQTIRRGRIENREQESTQIKKDFCIQSESKNGPWTVHWDGKLLQDITGLESVDRLPILVSSFETEQLLQIPKLISGTGLNIANAVFKSLQDWKLLQKINSMCFDTTSTNTGIHNGACVHLETHLKKKLLYSACRHHVSELMLGTVFECHMGASSAPDVQIFKRFKNQWSFFNHDDTSSSIELDNPAEIIVFCEERLKEDQPRDDYKELLELAILCAGGEPKRPRRGKRFMQPGAMHHARWMAKALYTLKIHLFRHQFKMTPREETAIKAISTFIIQFYIKYWFQTRLAISAPRLDLQLLKALKLDGSIAAKAAMQKLLGHLWYLNDHLIALSFFDAEVPNQIKEKMVQNLKIEREENSMRAKLPENQLAECDLSSFVSEHTKFFFETFGFSLEFLSLPVNSWNEQSDFVEMKNKLKHFRVVNDSAERGVALMHKFNKLITNDEEQKQYLLTVIAAHRKKYSKSVKKTELFN